MLAFPQYVQSEKPPTTSFDFLIFRWLAFVCARVAAVGSAHLLSLVGGLCALKEKVGDAGYQFIASAGTGCKQFPLLYLPHTPTAHLSRNEFGWMDLDANVRVRVDLSINMLSLP